MRNFLLAIVGVAFIVGNIVLFLRQPASDRFQSAAAPSVSYKTLVVGEKVIKAEVRDTPEGRSLGLSGKEALDGDEGMLFIFDVPSRYGIWMKDMNFPIDIVWLDSDKRIVHSEESVSPETYPQIFTPETEALYVLELPANFLSENMVDIGEIVSFE